MANPITAAYQAQQTVPVEHTAQVNSAAKPAGNKAAAPQDTVTISHAGHSASQAHQARQQAAQTKQAAADADHDGK